MAKIQRALISVYDKAGLVPFAKALVAAGVEIISTGGTAKALREAGIAVTDLSAYTGFPEMMDGRVKTLNPKVHGGLLYIRGNKEHEAAAAQNGIKPIDLVVVNLYPFRETIKKPDVTLEEAIENMDIGGPAMLRSAAKNHESVTVVVRPEDYDEVAGQVSANGETTLDLRRRLAVQVFSLTSGYDNSIAAYLRKKFNVPYSSFPGLTMTGPSQINVQPLRYGENPHQKAQLCGRFNEYFRQLHGKELSYNNILDLTSAAALIAEFADAPPTLAILKHANPCGVGQGGSLREAWEKAFATDKQAPFGGMIAVNRKLDLACARVIMEIFSEVIVAPSFAPEALEILQGKKNLRLMEALKPPIEEGATELRDVGAESYLIQDRDTKKPSAKDWKVVTKREPTPEEKQAMLFGWPIVKHVKSNAIVFAGPDRTLGIGAGQMSRVDASKIAVWKAGEAGLSLAGSVVCSDAFFPFPDGLVAAAKAGATAAIQPGGSKGDSEVIAAADEHGMAMIFTGTRHFRH